MVTLYQSFRLASTVMGLVFLSTGSLFAAPPSVPANFAAASPLVGTVDVTWNDVVSETTYELMWGPFPPGPTMTISNIPANTTSHTLANLPSGVSHHFKIRACNADGCSPFSGVIGQTPDGSTGLPSVPVNFALGSTQAGTDVAMWDDVINETSYEVMWGAFPPGPTDTISIPANTLFAIFPGLGSGISYHFKIRACNTVGCSDWSVVVGRTPDGSDTCLLSQHTWYAGGMGTISYLLAAKVPTTWKVWILGSFGSIQIVSLPLPAVPPVATGDISFPFPSLGTVGFVTALTTPSGGLVCSDFDKVNTGPGPAVASARGSAAPPLPDLLRRE